MKMASIFFIMMGSVNVFANIQTEFEKTRQAKLVEQAYISIFNLPAVAELMVEFPGEPLKFYTTTRETKSGIIKYYHYLEAPQWICKISASWARGNEAVISRDGPGSGELIYFTDTKSCTLRD